MDKRRKFFPAMRIEVGMGGGELSGDRDGKCASLS